MKGNISTGGKIHGYTIVFPGDKAFIFVAVPLIQSWVSEIACYIIIPGRKDWMLNHVHF